MLSRLIDVLTYPGSLRARLVAGLIRDNASLPLDFLIRRSAMRRPNYGYCLLHAARLARRLQIPRISALEFGVAGGNGLVEMERIAARVERETGVSIACFGFDMGEGLPPIANEYDLPYWWQQGFYKMDQEALKARLSGATLVLGNVSETVGNFCAEHDPPPIGAISFDLDYYSSTMDAFRLFDADPRHFLPRIYCYMDDVLGDEWEMYGEEMGVLKAIRDFNAAHPRKKLMLNTNLVSRTTQPMQRWHHQIYYLHDFDHPRYRDYVGGDDQVGSLEDLRLKE